VVTLSDGAEVSGQELIVAIGRTPRIHVLGLETVGIEPRPQGVAVDECCRAAAGVWAIGDATGNMPFTHVRMYQGRIIAADIGGRDVRADYSAIPPVVFCDPKIAAVGLTAEQAEARGVDVASAQVALAASIARPWRFERDPRGDLGVLADRERRVLVGAWAIASLAGEWIHYAGLAIKARIPLDVVADTVAQFPTYTEAYLKAIERLDVLR
jgi:pyruvate/2-oxoglutarate dehydrogenase complex dihydrolipoamide dehydrogenase (E3) component